jgi:hypothetical protein
LGEGEFPGSTIRDYWSSLLSRSILAEAILEHWKRGVTSKLGRGNREESVEIRLSVCPRHGWRGSDT